MANRVPLPIQESRHQKDFTSTESRPVNPATYKAKGQLGRQLVPEFLRNGARAQGWLVPRDQALVGRQSLTAAEIATFGSTSTHHRVDTAMEAEGQDTPGAESPIGQEEVVGVELVPELIEQLEFVVAPRSCGPGGEETCGETE